MSLEIHFPQYAGLAFDNLKRPTVQKSGDSSVGRGAPASGEPRRALLNQLAQDAQKLFDASVVSVLLQNLGARHLRDAQTCRFASTLLLTVSAPIRRKAQSQIAARVVSGVAMFTSLRSDAAQTRASFVSS